MNIDQLDEKLITEPMSKQERIKLINIFLNTIYLQGIDKGTALERARQQKVKMIKDRRKDKRYEQFLDKIEDLINIYEKRVYREKYKGRYNYYKPKKPKKGKQKNKELKQLSIF